MLASANIFYFLPAKRQALSIIDFSCWATSPSLFGEGKENFGKTSQTCLRLNPHVSHVRAGLVCGHKTIMMLMNVYVHLNDSQIRRQNNEYI